MRKKDSNKTKPIRIEIGEESMEIGNEDNEGCIRIQRKKRSRVFKKLVRIGT